MKQIICSLEWIPCELKMLKSRLQRLLEVCTCFSLNKIFIGKSGGRNQIILLQGVVWFVFFFFRLKTEFYFLEWKCLSSKLFTSLPFNNLSSCLYKHNKRINKQKFCTFVSRGQKKSPLFNPYSTSPFLSPRMNR